MPALESSPLEALLSQRQQLIAQLAQVGEMRPGSLVPRFRKCGKSSCHCAKQGDKGHGPSFSLTHSVDGKTITHVIPAGLAVDRTREQLDEYHRFRQLVQELISVSDRICDHQLRHPEPGIDSVKKKLARRPSYR